MIHHRCQNNGTFNESTVSASTYSKLLSKLIVPPPFLGCRDYYELLCSDYLAPHSCLCAAYIFTY